MHESLPVTFITLSVLAGILFNRGDITDLKADMNRQFVDVNRRLDIIDSPLKQFYTITGKLEGRVDELSRR